VYQVTLRRPGNGYPPTHEPTIVELLQP
jgi:hypothetical protein